MNRGFTFDAQTLIPDLLLAAPRARAVLDRYGLQGCGGALGPMESLEFFARAHGVPIGRLLDEIKAVAEENRAGERPAAEDAVYRESAADRVYRPFFQAGIGVALTLGAAWGVWLLLRIGFTGSFASAGLHEVNAHGHAQIFGWVGLFVMGFAYQAFPRFKHASLAYPKLAYATLGLMLAGIAARSLLEPAGLAYPQLWTLAVWSSLLEIAAIGLFVFIIAATWRRSGKPLEFYDYYIAAAMFWFAVQAVGEALLFKATVEAPSREALLGVVAAWQAPLREIQIYGFAAMMILGVSQRMFHPFYGLPEPDKAKSRRALILLNASLAGMAAGLVLMGTVSRAWGALWYPSVLVFAGTAAWLTAGWRIWSTPRETDRSLKFMRAAYAWLYVSLAMLVLLPLYQFVLLPAFAPGSGAAAMGFSHAYYGAVRHAVTVGFISLMIVGVAAKVVPTLNGVSVHSLPPLWVPFVLINAGCILRVSGQTLTDFVPAAFPLAGVSGLLELAGLAVWGVHILAVMAGKARVRSGGAVSADAYTPVAPNGALAESNLVGDALDRHPGLLDEFVRRGFWPLKNPVLRSSLAKTVTIGQAARKLGLNPEELVRSLNEAAAAPVPNRGTNGCAGGGGR